MDNDFFDLLQLHKWLGIKINDLTISDLRRLDFFYEVELFGRIEAPELNSEALIPDRVFARGLLQVDSDFVFKLLGESDPIFNQNGYLPPDKHDLIISVKTILNGDCRGDLIGCHFLPEDELIFSPTNILVEVPKAIDILDSMYGLPCPPYISASQRIKPKDISVNEEKFSDNVEKYRTDLLDVLNDVVNEFWVYGAPQGANKKDVTVDWMMNKYKSSHGLSRNMAISIDTITRPPEEKKKTSRR